LPKLIADFVSGGISGVADLQAALQLAMQLEFATIPPYLCAEWSINDDPDDVTDIIHSVVMQEMFHFAIAGNLLSAIGGTPQVANSAFVPAYPTNTLPGGIAQALPIDLLPLSKDQLQVFMQIEKPEFEPVAHVAEVNPPATIGAFYGTISDAFTALQPPINASAPALLRGSAQRINTVADAIAAIETIKEEGEGTTTSPEEPATDSNSFSHFYLFEEVFKGNKLVQVGGTWQFTGPAISMPTVFPFTRSAAVPSPSIAFNKALVGLLQGLEACWTAGQAFSAAAMFNLQAAGSNLIQQGITPEFKWID